MCESGWISSSFGEHDHGSLWRTVFKGTESSEVSVATEVAQVVHRVRQSLECIVDLSDDLVAQDDATEFVLPGKYPFDGSKALLEDCRIEHALWTTFGGFSVAPCVRLVVAALFNADDPPKRQT